MAFLGKKKKSELPHRRVAAEDRVRSPRREEPGQNVFRRGRTLTGSTSNNVTSADHYRADMTSPRTHAHHLTGIRRRVGLLLLGFLIAAGSMYWLLTQLTAQISVNFADAAVSRTYDSSIYIKTINDYLNANPVERLRFTLSSQALSQYLSRSLPEIDSVTNVAMNHIGESTFTLSVRKPVAGWKIQGKQYYVDAKGVAFERNFYVDPTVQIVDQSGAVLQQGTAIASNRFLAFVGRVVALSKARNLIVTDAILPEGTTRQLEVKLENVTSLVKLSIDRPAGEQVEDMARSLAYLALKKQTPSYIDVRVSGKAFYQ
jgi:hypothetical protein